MNSDEALRRQIKKSRDESKKIAARITKMEADLQTMKRMFAR